MTNRSKNPGLESRLKVQKVLNQESREKENRKGKMDFMERLNGLGRKSIYVALSLCGVILLCVFWDFVTFQKVLLFKDIGSDSINVFYPKWALRAELWELYRTTNAYSLHSVMGESVSFNQLDVFTWLTIIFGKDSIPYILVFKEMLKCVLTLLFSFQLFRLMNLSVIVALTGSLCFAFSGYMLMGFGAWHNFSEDVLWLALGVWMVEYTISKKKFFWIVVPVVMFILGNRGGTIFFHLVAGLIFYFVIRSIEYQRPKMILMNSLNFIGLAAIGLLAAYSSIQSKLKMIFASGRQEAIEVAGGGAIGENPGKGIFVLADASEYYSLILRAFSTNLMGVGNEFKGWMNYLEAPLLYVGIPMLLFIPFFFIQQDKIRKRLYSSLVVVVAISLIFPWFRNAFWGFQLDYFRNFTMIIGVFLLIISMRGFDRFLNTTIKPPKWLLPSIVIVLMIVLFRASSIDNFDPGKRALVVFLLLGYGLSLLAYQFTRKSGFLILFMGMVLIDLGSNAYATVNERDIVSEKDIQNGELFSGNTLKALEFLKEHDKDLYRIAKNYSSGPAIHMSMNDAMVQGFNGLIGYSSFHYKYYLRFMRELGCIDPTNADESKWVYKVLNRPFLSSFLGAKYFLNKGNPMDFDPNNFVQISQVKDIYITESKLALPLVIAYDKYILQDDFRKLGMINKDYVLYQALVVEPNDVKSLHMLTPFNLSDTLSGNLSSGFTKVAMERRRMMNVIARPTLTGIEADIELPKSAVVVFQVPNRDRNTVFINGEEQEKHIGNFGFPAMAIDKPGKYAIEFKY